MIRLLFIALFSLTMSACTIKPAIDYRSDKDFSQYRSFAFVALTEDEVNSIDSVRIRDAVVLQLEQKGLAQTDIKNADLQVRFRVESEAELEAYGASTSFGFTRKMGSISMSTPVQYYERQYGKIVLELLDPQTQSIVWKSISQRRLQETLKVDKRTKFINDEVAIMLAEYPPEIK